ncbi:MAG: DUF898 family protein [Bacteroidia bacterium]|jgi:uncharacterized membrane protein YjgN (DUF898 family)
MEIIKDPAAEQTPNKLSFKADGWEFLGILILNWILTSVTFFVYYPWARVARLKFIYQSARLNDTPFVFSGTGNELFKGFIKVLLLFGTMFGTSIWISYTHVEWSFILGYAYAVILLFLIPLAMHSALRYRLARTSWRGVFFGYRGERQQLMLEFVMGYVLVFLTGGLYTAWFVDGLRRYIIGNIRFGNLRFGFDGTGGKLFFIYAKGIFFGVLTLGIYYFWYMKEWMNYFAEHTFIEQGDKRFYLKPHYTGGAYFGLMIVNVLMLIFTFGLATPFVIIRTATFVLTHLEVPQELNLDHIAQTEDEFADATGEDVIDFLDLGII